MQQFLATRGYKPVDAVELLRALDPYGQPTLYLSPDLVAQSLATRPAGATLSVPVGATSAATTAATPATAQQVRDELQYCDFNDVQLSVGVVSQKFLLRPPAGARRTYLYILNTDAAKTMYLAFGHDASTGSVPLVPGGVGFFEWNKVIPQGDVYLIASGAGATGILLYANGAVTL